MVSGGILLLAAACGTGAEPSTGGPGEDLTQVGTPDVDVEPAVSDPCPDAPEGTDKEGAAAFARANFRRRGMGLGCLTYSESIARSSTDHCAYYVANAGTSCVANPHKEAPSCRGFVGESFTDRLKAAGFQGYAAYEVMTYVGKGERAVDLWIDSVWHRIPLLSPQVSETGYGRAGACDTMEFSWAERSTKETVAFYPFAGQTLVPTKFEGRENPEPPKPPKGWPSGYPVTLYATGVKVTSHSLAVDGSTTNIPHIFIAPGTPESRGLLIDEFMLYSHEPLAGKTTYRVKIEGTKAGKPVVFEWTFKTR